MTSTTIIIHPIGTVIVEEYNSPYVTGQRIHDSVGGSFEVLTCGRICLWFKEHPTKDGVNFDATMIGASFAAQEIPTIRGPVLFTGPADKDGNTHGLTHDQVARIQALTMKENHQ